MDSPSFPVDTATLLALTCAPLSAGRDAIAGMLPSQARLALIDAAVDAGAVDHSLLAVGGLPPAVAWEAASVDLPPALLAKMGGSHPTLGSSVDGLLPFFHVVRGTGRPSWESRDYQVEGRVARWLGGAPLAALGIQDRHAAAAIWPALEQILARKKSLPQASVWKGWMEVLARRGVAWDAPAQALSGLSSVELCSALLDQGLDVLQKVSVGGEAMPLWKAWGLRPNPAMTAMLTKKVHPESLAPDDLEAMTVARYFDRFGELSIRGKQTLLEQRLAIWTHLTSRPDWPSLADREGKSALFFAAQAEPGVLRHALDALRKQPDAARVLGALRHRDRLGRGLWFHLLPFLENNTFTDRMVDDLEAVVGTAFSRSDRGWRWVALEDFRGACRAWALPGAKVSSWWSKKNFREASRAVQALAADGWENPGGQSLEWAVESTLRTVPPQWSFLAGVPDPEGRTRLAQVWQRALADLSQMTASSADLGAAQFPSDSLFPLGPTELDAGVAVIQKQLKDLQLKAGNTADFRAAVEGFLRRVGHYRLDAVLDMPALAAPRPRAPRM